MSYLRGGRFTTLSIRLLDLAADGIHRGFAAFAYIVVHGLSTLTHIFVHGLAAVAGGGIDLSATLAHLLCQFIGTPAGLLRGGFGASQGLFSGLLSPVAQFNGL